MEFDDPNKVVLTYNARTTCYKVWSLDTYSLLYKLRHDGADEVKLTPGHLVLLYAKGTVSRVRVKMLDIHTGRETSHYTHFFKRRKQLEFVELFNGHLLVKQVGEDLEIINMATSTVKVVSRHKFHTPSAFIFLYACGRFLTFRDNSVAAYDCSGKKVTSFDGVELWHKDCSSASVHVTSKQDTLISYCKSEEDGRGSITVSDILTGARLASLEDSGTAVESDASAGMQSQASAVRRALRGVTAVHYDEETHQLFTGTRKGKVAVWGTS